MKTLEDVRKQLADQDDRFNVAIEKLRRFQREIPQSMLDAMTRDFEDIGTTTSTNSNQAIPVGIRV